MYDPWGYTRLGVQELRFLQENIRGELSDSRKYLEQAWRTSDPALRQLWLRIAADERRHALQQARILRAAAPGAAILPGLAENTAADVSLLG